MGVYTCIYVRARGESNGQLCSCYVQNTDPVPKKHLTGAKIRADTCWFVGKVTVSYAHARFKILTLSLVNTIDGSRYVHIRTGSRGK